MIVDDNAWSNRSALFNYQGLSSTILDYHEPFDQGLTLSPPRAGFPAQGKSISNTMRRKSGEKNMADNAASYRGRFCWRGVFLLQLGSQINFPNSLQEKTWRFHLKILSYCEFFERYASPFLNVFE